MNAKLTASLLALALTSPVVYGQDESPAQPQQTQAQADQASRLEQELNKPLSVDPQLRTGVLENGLHYMIRPTKEPAGRASVRLFVDAGSLNETPENSGISHFLEHMVFNGSRHFKRGELIPTMEKLGLGFGGDANAYTSFLQTVYMIDMPKLDDVTVDFAMTIVRDFGDGALLEDDAIDHERGIVISELKSRDSEGMRAQIEMMRTMTSGTRLADYMPIGLESVIRDAPYSVVRDYYRNHYVPANMTVIITGDVTYEQAEEWIKKHFASMEARTPEPREALGSPQNVGPEEKVLPVKEQGNVNITMAVVNPYEDKPDTLQQRVEDLPLQIALGMVNKRLARMSRKADCTFLSASVDRNDMMKISDIFSMSLTSAPGKWKEAVTTVEKEIRSAIEHGFSQQEMNEILLEMTTHLEQSCSTWESVTAPNMAKSIVDSLAEGYVFTAPSEDLRVFAIGMQKILENTDVFREALAKSYDADRVKLLAIGAIPEDLTPEALRATFNEAHSQAAPKPDQAEVQSFAYDTVGEPGHIVAEQHLPEIDTTIMTLSNGVRVNLKATQSKKNTIAISALVDGGSFHMPDTPGLPSMVASMMNNGGLEAHTLDDMQSIFSGKHVGVDFKILEDRFAFSGSTNRRDFELQCKLLIASIMHPGYRKDGEDLLRRKMPAVYKKMNTTLDGVYSTQSSRILFGDDTRFNMPSEEEMTAMTTEQARAAIEPLLKDGAIEVTIVGDFELDAIKPVLERTFGAMTGRKAEFAPVPDESRKVKMNPWGQTVTLRYPTELDKTLVSHLCFGGNGLDRKHNRRMQVLASIVSEKLFNVLRANLGQSYSPIVRYTANEEYENAAVLSMMSYGVKGNRVLVNSAMQCLRTIIGQGDISEEDFECAIRPAISRLEKEMRSNAFWSANLSCIQSKPEKLENLRGLVADMHSITHEEIVQLAKDVFSLDNADCIFTVPEDTPDIGETPQPGEAPATEPENNTETDASTASATVSTPCYVVLISEKTAQSAEWRQVASTLVEKYRSKGWTVPDVVVLPLDKTTPSGIAAILRDKGARYAAYVIQPQEIFWPLVSILHRAARQVDDDPWGDCIWGIVTGNSAADAQRIAAAQEPLVIKRLLATTNIGAGHFEYSYCITDWTNAPVLEQSGYTEPTQTTYTQETPEGQAVLANGMQGLFAERLEHARAQLLVTSSHATQFNLEMPFSRGLIFPTGNRFYPLPQTSMPHFGQALDAAMKGDGTPMAELVKQQDLSPIEPDGTTRVWLAAGNCLIGDACFSPDSMVATALSAYTCNQFVGYTLPSWYGAGGWGTLSCFFDNTDGTTLAEAWFLNNQFILLNSMEKHPDLLNVQFNGGQIESALHKAGIKTAKPEELKDLVGLVYDRDIVAFYGDPAWSASLDCEHSHCPFRIEWKDAKTFTITANGDHKGRCAVWFPSAECGRDAAGCDAEGAVFTNDFILFPELEMKKGETKTVTLRASGY